MLGIGLVRWQGPFLGLDYFILDGVQRWSLAQGFGPQRSDELAYITITDDTYRILDRSYLERNYLARVNQILSQYGAQAIAYDLILARTQSAENDFKFQESLEKTLPVFLPTGFYLLSEGHERGAATQEVDQEDPAGNLLDKLQINYLKKNIKNKYKFKQFGQGAPPRAERAYMNRYAFHRRAAGSGHVSAPADADGVFRHFFLFVDLHGTLFPSLSLALFLDTRQVDSSLIEIHWGSHVLIPADAALDIENDLRIPIDAQGRMVISYVSPFVNDFEKISLHALLEYSMDSDYYGNLQDLLEDRLLLLGDVSTGIADMGSTPIENDVPLVALHAALLNSFLVGDFYREANFFEVSLILLISFLGLYLCSLPERRRYLNLFILVYLSGLVVFSLFSYRIRYLAPIALIGMVVFGGYLILIIIQEYSIYRRNLRLERENDLLHRELDIALQIQQSILPGELPEFKNISMCGVSQPARFVGGDFYDLIQIDEDSFLMALGDVTGKGVPAALFMSGVVSSLRSIVISNKSREFSLLNCVLELNHVLWLNSASRKRTLFVTAVFVLVDLNQSSMTIVRCGHEPPIIIRDSKILEFKPPGFVLGVLESKQLQGFLADEIVPLKPADLLCLYTDGITEAHNPAGDFFEQHRLEVVLKEGMLQKLDVIQIRDNLLADLSKFRQDADRYDDITFMLMNLQIPSPQDIHIV